jgi:hypothetical protein
VANEPVCWVIPGDDNAKMNGAVDAMAWREGEFTKPLFDQPNSFSMDRHIEALDRVAELEALLRDLAGDEFWLVHGSAMHDVGAMQEFVQSAAKSRLSK